MGNNQYLIDELLYREYLDDDDLDRSDDTETQARTASISRFALRTVRRLVRDGRWRTEDSFDVMVVREEAAALGDAADDREFLRETRILKYRELLGIMKRDVLGGQPEEQTLVELSDLADALIAAVCTYTRNRYFSGVEHPLTVIAMGKLGARELNFSSDVDLVYVHGDDHTDNTERYSKWAVKINQLLSGVTADGFLYRVDNDLRPGGRFSPLAMSAAAVSNHYFLYGETWQRVALLRARFLWGDGGLAESIIGELMPFIYRRYLDFSMISQLRDLKHRINSESLTRDREGVNIKLGRGGIREAEFFVQVLQIMNGGKNQRLRKVRISEAVDALVRESLISPEDGAELINAYLLLRKAENAVQMEEEHQTYLLPRDSDDLERAARRAGFPDAGSFVSALETVRAVVSRLFDGLFGEKTTVPVLHGEEDVQPDALWHEAAALHWDDPVLAERFVRAMADGAAKIPVKYRKGYGIFLHVLFTKIAARGRQAHLFAMFDDFVRTLIKRPVYISLLVENPPVVDQLIDVFFFGGYLSRILLNHPDSLDFIVSHDAVDRSSFASYGSVLAGLVAGVDDFEDRMYLLRQFKNSEWLKIGLMYHTGAITYGEMEFFLTNLAEAILMTVVSICSDIVGEKVTPPVQDFVLIGLGKLGTGEMNFFSDLDLIFLYRSADERAGVFNTRLLQRVIAALTTVTREGELYKVDMRLRPTGSQGPLVTSVDNFIRYHAGSSWLFEKQALTKGRVLGVRTPFVVEVENIIEHILYSEERDGDLLIREISGMRDRMEKEGKSSEKKDDIVELKTGAGGIVDVEFIVQYAKLRYGREWQSLRVINPDRALEALAGEHLFPDEWVQTVRRAYVYLKRVESMLRLYSGYARDSFSVQEEQLDEIVQLLGYAQGGRNLFLADLKKNTASVRDVFSKIFS